MALMHEGLVPDVSLGTHFFNDLVEMEMVYLAVYPEKNGYLIDFQLLMEAENRLRELVPDAAQREDVVRVIEADSVQPGSTLFLHADPVRQRAVCWLDTGEPGSG